MDRTEFAGAAADGLLANALAALRAGNLNVTELIDRAQQLVGLRRLDAAATLYRAWLDSGDSPYRNVALYNLGTVLGSLDRCDEAAKVYREALASKPDFIQAHLNLGHQLERLGQREAALAEWRSVLDLLDIQPELDADTELRLHALNNLARALEEMKRYDEAETYMEVSLAIRPDQPKVIQHFVHIRQKQCAWPAARELPGVSANKLLMATSPLATLASTDDPAVQLLAASRFVAERVRQPAPLPAHRDGREGKLRIGYLSGDFCLHAVGLLTPELFELHDRERFEIYGFCWSREDGTSLRKRLVEAFDHHVPIGHLDDETAARVIHANEIDVLIDLQGLTAGARPDILALRPAPVQIAYLGLPGTSALPGVDHVIADRYVMPDSLLPYMTEQPVYLPHCYQVSDRKREVGVTPTRAQAGLPDDAFVFCSFNNNYKFTEPMFASWMRILAGVPNSVLWLLADNLWAEDNLHRAAAAAGVNPARLIFAPRVGPADYLARLPLADLFLDTFPFNAGTTANDALFMGLPLVTRSGRSYISRMAGSLLTAVGLPDLIADDAAGYEKLAIALGNTPARVASYRRYLAEQRMNTPLFDIPGIVRELEAAYERLAG
ncbi:O-linked N-acetylglucosamine transferase, SPINDLY family protein [Derxia lacustris]|uniref:O-linked N-acetylglucosamine transferase, SPINDLY family protein n=1 Tax=Derxia lacustris TaxID=764842 RepID=UPI000A173942|nr:tetratricopeptide repeat protein [Derxia lacustris]